MRAAAAVLLLVLTLAADAKVEMLQFSNPDDEQRYQHLIAELRCLVCQNQNLADSDAELAQDLRQQTYEMIERGASDDEIIAFMVARYGDFVLYRPPLRTTTLLLWVGPFLLVGLGIAVLVTIIRRRAGDVRDVTTDTERARVRALLASGEEKRSP